MRKKSTPGDLTIQAIAGNHAVFLGLDLVAAARKDCLGFAIHRLDETENEQYWLSSFKTFKSVVPNPDPKQLYSTLDHPIQSFYWGDYSAKPGHKYTYTVVPRCGKPKSLTNGPDASVTVTTSNADEGKHGVYFNRGVAASQAYVNKFHDSPDRLPKKKQAEAKDWLSRGLLKAILDFIAQGTSANVALRAAVYEFTQEDVLAAFKTAHAAGADVEIIYHARDDETGNRNRAAIRKAGLPQSILVERMNAPIAHNKFIVLCRRDAGGALKAEAVWTGSTNLSEGGIFGHSNVGHAVRDPDVADEYFQFWKALKPDPDPATVRDWVSQHSPFSAQQLVQPGTHTLFSPRHGRDPLDWYAKAFGSPAISTHITMPFGMGVDFENSLKAYQGAAIHYVLLDKKDDNEDQWGNLPGVFFAVGTRGGPNALATWAQEHLTGYNAHVPYLHTKILLLDPLEADPEVISGSANFSLASTSTNDENMLLIQGDTEVADVYFTEYARIFNHFYARYWANRLTTGPADAEAHSFLDETPAWLRPYFVEGSPKCQQRQLLLSTKGNA